MDSNTPRSVSNSTDCRVGLHTLVDGLTTPTIVSQTSSRSVFGVTSHPASSLPTSDIPTVTASSSKPKLHHFETQKSEYQTHPNGSGSRSDSATKEVDDPTTTTALLDTTQVNVCSRDHSFQKASVQHGFTQGLRSNSFRGSDSVKLEEFLYTRGFLEGTCSDISIIAFGNRYRLHRLILDRSPFFSSCFNGGPWVESTLSEISLSPEKSDPNISQYAFELALARLYGHVDRTKEDQNALPLFAVASYLELEDLAESCVASLLRNLKPGNISPIVKFVTNSYYGPLAGRLLDSAKALLYRDGWEMKLWEWDGINAEFAAEIIGYEGFYVPTEYSRYIFVRDLINWRIERPHDSLGMSSDSANRGFAAESLKLGDGCGDESSCGYFDTDINALQELLHTGIYYMHMSFEELQRISDDKDLAGRHIVDENLIRNALWQQMLLRQKVLNSSHDSPELGITNIERLPSTRNAPNDGKPPNLKETSQHNNRGIISSNLIRTGESKDKYYIPTEDSTTVIGDCPEPPHVIVSQRGASRNLIRNDLQVSPYNVKREIKEDDKQVKHELRYSQFPPFRFSAEFENVRTLKEKKRVYSKTVFYAGSYWNIYIQKVKSSKNVQLGVYLHRAKDREGCGMSNSAVRNSESNQTSHTDERGCELSERSFRNDNEDSMGSATLTETDITATTYSSVLSSRLGTERNATRLNCGADVNWKICVPTLGSYIDSRPMIQTYFKIFSPSRKGKMLSMFSSCPDSFNFSQSWGWKSSSLILDEGLIGESDRDSCLRFMVVLGMVPIEDLLKNIANRALGNI